MEAVRRCALCDSIVAAARLLCCIIGITIPRCPILLLHDWASHAPHTRGACSATGHLTGIFSAWFISVHLHCWWSPSSISMFCLSSVSVSLTVECKSKISRVCDGRAAEGWEELYLQRGYYSRGGSWSYGGIMHNAKLRAAPPFSCTPWRLV